MHSWEIRLCGQMRLLKKIYRIRDEYAKSSDYDLDAIFADLRKKEAASNREVVTLLRKPGLTARRGRRESNISNEMKENNRRSI